MKELAYVLYNFIEKYYYSPDYHGTDKIAYAKMYATETEARAGLSRIDYYDKNAIEFEIVPLQIEKI